MRAQSSDQIQIIGTFYSISKANWTHTTAHAEKCYEERK